MSKWIGFIQRTISKLFLQAEWGQKDPILNLKTAQGQTGNAVEINYPLGVNGDMLRIDKDGNTTFSLALADTLNNFNIKTALANAGTITFQPSYGNNPRMVVTGGANTNFQIEACSGATNGIKWTNGDGMYFKSWAGAYGGSCKGNGGGKHTWYGSIGNNALGTACGGTIIDHFTDAGSTGTGETDLYSDSIIANTFVTNADKVKAEYGVLLTNSTSSKRLRLYFAGTAIWDSGVLTTNAAGQISLYVTLTRVSATVVRYNASASVGGLSVTNVAPAVGELTGLTLTSANILKITGLAANVVGSDAANNDILAKLGVVDYYAAA